jgi:hypothetical protein
MEYACNFFKKLVKKKKKKKKKKRGLTGELNPTF